VTVNFYDGHLRVRTTVKDPSPATLGILGIGSKKPTLLSSDTARPHGMNGRTLWTDLLQPQALRFMTSHRFAPCA
jgi:hypothetical protein